MAKAARNELSWFDLNNYTFIYDVTLLDLIKELEWRDCLFRSFDYDDNIFDHENEIKFERIFNGDPNLENLSQEELDNEELIRAINAEAPSLINEYGELPTLSSRDGVSPVTFTELSMYSYSAIEQGFFKRDEEYTYIKADAMLASVSGNLKKCLSNSALVSINLNDATDEEIVNNLSKLLPLWRQQLSLPEQEYVAQKRIGIKTLQKLISNRVLPILDLLLWEKVSGKEITNPMISMLVFGDDPKDTQAIKDTIKPFAIESMSEPYTRLLRLYVSKDGEIGSSTMSNIMQRIL